AAGGIRAADPRCDARRRDPLHPRRRDRGAVGARRRDRGRLGARPRGLSELRRRYVGPAVVGRARAPRRALVAPPLMPRPAVEEWTGVDVSIAQVEAGVAELRAMEAEAGEPSLRTSVMTHIAWVPPEWLDAAERTLEGMAERHPSRTVILVPRPDE